MCLYFFSRSFIYVHQSGLILPATILSVRTHFIAFYFIFQFAWVCVASSSHPRNFDPQTKLCRVNKLIFVYFVCAHSDSWFWTKRNDEYRTSHAIIWMRWAWHRQTCLVCIWYPLLFIKSERVFWLILVFSFFIVS